AEERSVSGLRVNFGDDDPGAAAPPQLHLRFRTVEADEAHPELVQLAGQCAEVVGAQLHIVDPRWCGDLGQRLQIQSGAVGSARIAGAQTAGAPTAGVVASGGTVAGGRIGSSTVVG